MQLKLPFVSDWVTVLIVVALFFIAYLTANYKKQFRNLFLSFFSRNKIEQIIREESGTLRRVQISMNLLYFLIVSLLINKYVITQIINTRGLLFWFVIFTTLLTIYIVKYLVIRLLGELFNLQKISSEYTFNVFLLHQFNAVLLLPLAVLSYYLSYGHYQGDILELAGIIILTSIVVRLFKLIQIGTSYKGFSILYLFIYICTLEILPMAIGYKFLIYR